jgi:hypothetical protein
VNFFCHQRNKQKQQWQMLKRPPQGEAVRARFHKYDNNVGNGGLIGMRQS